MDIYSKREDLSLLEGRIKITKRVEIVRTQAIKSNKVVLQEGICIINHTLNRQQPIK